MNSSKGYNIMAIYGIEYLNEFKLPFSKKKDNKSIELPDEYKSIVQQCLENLKNTFKNDKYVSFNESLEVLKYNDEDSEGDYPESDYYYIRLAEFQLHEYRQDKNMMDVSFYDSKELQSLYKNYSRKVKSAKSPDKRFSFYVNKENGLSDDWDIIQSGVKFKRSLIDKHE